MDLLEENIHCPPAEFQSVITMPSTDFQKICRDMHNLSDNIEIQSSLSSEDISMMEENHTAAHVNFAIEKSDLSMLEKKAITLRFDLNRREDPMTFSQVGTLTGLSTMGAQKAVIRGLKKLKNNSYIKELIE